MDALGVAGWLLMFFGLVSLHDRMGWSESLVTSTDAYQSLLQVVPAVVVGVYALALGSVFVIAQSVAPARGTRSIRLLLLEFRFRAMMSGTILVAILSVVLAGQAPAAAWPASNPPWSVSAVAVLGEMTIGIVLAFTFALLHLFHVYSSPSRFHGRLATTSWEGVGHLEESVRVARQWLCTAARQGQSRDLLYACEGVHKIYGAYATLTREGKRVRFRSGSTSPGLEREAGLTGLEARSIDRRERVATALELAATRGVVTAGSPHPRLRPDVRMRARPDGWFALQISRALVRATEEAARADVATRNLDELLRTQEELVCVALSWGHNAEAVFFLQGIRDVTRLPQANGTNASTWLKVQEGPTQLAQAIRDRASGDPGLTEFVSSCKEVLDDLARRLPARAAAASGSSRSPADRGPGAPWSIA